MFLFFCSILSKRLNSLYNHTCMSLQIREKFQKIFQVLDVDGRSSSIIDNLKPSCYVLLGCWTQLNATNGDLLMKPFDRWQTTKTSLQSRWLSPSHIDYHVVPPVPCGYWWKPVCMRKNAHLYTNSSGRLVGPSVDGQCALVSGTIVPPELGARDMIDLITIAVYSI